MQSSLKLFLAFISLSKLLHGRSMIQSYKCLTDKQWNRLDVGERGDLRLKLTHLQPNVYVHIRSHQFHPSNLEMCFLGKLLNWY